MSSREDSRSRDAGHAPPTAPHSQILLRRAHELAGVGTYVIDLNRQVIHLSPETVWMLRAGTEAVSLPLEEYGRRFHFPADRAATRAAAIQAHPRGHASRWESRVVRGDGRIIWVRSSASVENDEQGEPIVVGVLVDVTESREAMNQLAEQTAQLEESSERLQLATSSAGIGIWDWDLVENRLVWDDTMCRLHGLEPERFAGSREAWESLISPKDRARVAASLRGEAGEGRGWNAEFAVCWPDGSSHVLHAESRTLRDAEGRTARMIGVAYDVAARLRAEQARNLLDTEARFRALSDNSLAGIYIVQDGRLSYVNRSLERTFGYSRGELLGADPLTLFAPSDRARAADSIRTTLNGAVESVREESRGIKKSGEPFDVEVLGAAVELGGARALIGNVIDITARKKVQAALEESEQRFRTLIDEAPVAIGVSRHGTGIYANRKFLQLWNYSSSDDVVGHSVAAHWSPEQRTKVAEWAQARSLGLPAPPSYVGVAQRRDGTQFPAHVDVMLVDLPDGRASIAFITDLSERERAEAAIRESEQRFREIAESIDELFWVTDPAQNQFLYVSPAYEKIWGKPPGDLRALARNWLETIHAEDREAVRVAAGKQMRDGYEQTYRIVRPDGTVRWIRERAFPVQNADGDVYRVVGTAVDVTEQRSLQSQLLQAQKMEAIGVLAGGVAHDFNNILAVILSYTSLLIPEMNPREPMREDLLEIQKAAERAVALTRQLLAFSRRQVFQLQVVDLNQVLAGTEKMLRRLIGEDVQLSTLPAPEGAYALVDIGQIEQVLLNLVVNSRDAMPDGGTISIEIGHTRLSDADAVRFGLTSGRHVLLTVRDTGIGMDTPTQQRVFEPFFTTKEPGKGTGLGLATVFGIVKQSRGHVAVVSEPGRGATFRIWLPCASVEDVPMPPLKRDEEPHGSETILVVEDEESVRKLVRAILSKKGYHVLDAQSGGDALLICERHAGAIDLVLTDVVMPMMNGEQLFSRLSALRPNLRVLYMSGYPERTNSILGSSVKQEFIAKPFAPERLLARVREVLAKPAPA